MLEVDLYCKEIPHFIGIVSIARENDIRNLKGHTLHIYNNKIY